MAFAERVMVIGFTAPFGSGSTTSADLLRKWMGFEHVRLSAVIRSDFASSHPDPPTRLELQRHGDEMRQTLGSDVLVKRALEALKADAVDRRYVAVDGIKNVAEIEHLRDVFGNRFFFRD